MTRLYFSGELQPGRKCLLPRSQARHAVRVLRLKAGEEIILFNGDGTEYRAVIERPTEDGLVVQVRESQAADREAPLPVTLAQGVSSGERMDFTLQKAVELGVAAIQPLVTSRSIVRLDAERAAKRLAHWQGVVIAACEQCGRNRVPRVEPLRAIDEWTRALARAPAAGVRLLLSPRASTGLRNLERPEAGVLLLAGPEGGLAPEEERDALAAGFSAVRLGPRVLRTETAALAALAALQALWGDF
ncbi:MAG: 16S rRNA methyltransferase [Betaproteobacteria bacterium SG8_41]|nr:MAG: 16S rRNA methyltransferase [Betaproteobacteria bacterium SG8_41]